jgi:hypothetical protein
MWFKLVAIALGTQGSQEPIVTDRPDFTESSVVVPLRRLQIETGFTAGMGDERSFVLPEALFRYGFAQGWEWRLGLPSYNREVSASGFGDTYLGLKRELGTSGGFQFAAIPGATIDTGRSEFSAGTWIPELKLCASTDLSENSALSTMLHVAAVPGGRGREAVFVYTLSLAQALQPKLSAFLEYAGEFSRSIGPQHIAHAGLVYLLDNDRQLDVHFGADIHRPSSTWFIAGGFSIRL